MEADGQSGQRRWALQRQKNSLERENLIGREPDVEKELRKLAEAHLKRGTEEERLKSITKMLKGI